MPNTESFTEKLVAFLTEDFDSRSIDAFDELTLMVWAEAKDLSKSLAFVGLKYNVPPDKLLQLSYTMQLLDVIHLQECKYNIERSII